MSDKDKLLRCLAIVGIDGGISQIQDDEDIGDLFEDSLVFMSFVVEIEQEFQVEIPTEFLLLKYFSSIKNILQLIDSIK